MNSPSQRIGCNLNITVICKVIEGKVTLPDCNANDDNSFGGDNLLYNLRQCV
jgi:hypothetical protein